ncbi:MAG TPA: hypothetical protein VGN86_02635 [Pyrinomonadaceae bacterium]|nr:hypothetical protein [Pyrinomonadaceae bacterium]
MKVKGLLRQSLWASTLVIVFLMAIPAVTNAQGRGRGRWNRDWDGKCGKFVNCHDARDGRWDGRGPRRYRNVFRNDRWNRRDNIGGRVYNNNNRYDSYRLRRMYRGREINSSNRWPIRRYVVRQRRW